MRHFIFLVLLIFSFCHKEIKLVQVKIINAGLELDWTGINSYTILERVDTKERFTVYGQTYGSVGDIFSYAIEVK